MRSVVKPMVLGLALWLSAAGEARARDWHLSLLGAGQVVAAPEFDPLAGDDGLAYFQIEGGLEIDELLEGLSLELAYQTADRSASLFSGEQPELTTGLMLHGLSLSAVYRLPLADWLGLAGRLGGSLDFVRLRVAGTEAGTLLERWELACPGGFATLGLELSLPRTLWRRWLDRPAGDPRSGFTIGLRLEAGWQLRAPLDYGRVEAKTVAADGEGAAVERRAIDLGRLRLDGFLWRAGLYAVF